MQTVIVIKIFVWIPQKQNYLPAFNTEGSDSDLEDDIDKPVPIDTLTNTGTDEAINDEDDNFKAV